MKKHLIWLVGLLLVIASLGLISAQVASATEGGDEPCVPSDAWTETIHHDAVTHVVHHDAVTHVVHHDAVTHTVHVIDVEAVPAVWANFSPNNIHETFIGPALWPTDPRGTWNIHDQLPPGQEGPDGVYANGNPDKGGNWFYRHAAVLEVSHDEVVVDQQAYDETVVDQEAYDETVVDQEAYDETVEHPAVTCTGEQPDPVVSSSSSSAYNCGDDFETVTTVVTTTEYVLVDDEWVLGEPSSETTTEQNPVDVVPCDTDEPPVDNPPTDTPPVVTHNPAPPKAPAAVPTVVDAGL